MKTAGKIPAAVTAEYDLWLATCRHHRHDVPGIAQPVRILGDHVVLRSSDTTRYRGGKDQTRRLTNLEEVHLCIQRTVYWLYRRWRLRGVIVTMFEGSLRPLPFSATT